MKGRSKDTSSPVSTSSVPRRLLGSNARPCTVWESSEHHKKFREIAPEKFSQLFATSKDAVSGPGELVRHQFKPVLEEHSPIEGLEAKTSELVIVTPQPGATTEAILKAGIKVHDVLNSNGHPAAFHQSVDGSPVFFMLVGWDSAEV